ncbi:MAG: Gfo/Idh/MocA family protein [Kiritimatiellia bacterium]
MPAKFRWGILAPGTIAHKFAAGIQALPDAELVAVGSRALERAQDFAAKYRIPRAYGSYQELAADAQVDAIYVATPHHLHAETTILCLEHGHAVLCEKPFAGNSQQAEAMVACARRRGVFLMEAMWSRFLPVMDVVAEWLKQGRIGELRRVECDFSFRGDGNPLSRLLNPALCGGGLLDVGIYPLAFTSWVFGGLPQQVASLAEIGRTGVDEQAGILLLYPGGAMAVLTCGVRTQGQVSARILGTEGSIEIPSPFFCAREAVLRTPQSEVRERRPLLATGYEYEAMEVARCVRAGLLESPAMRLEESLDLTRFMTRLRKQWGVRYPFDP